MKIKFIAIAVILLLQFSPTTLFSNDKADSLFKAKAKKRDSLMFRLFYRNQNYFTSEFREKMRNYEIRNNLLKNIITQKVFYLFEYGDSTLNKKENFQAYFGSIMNMGDTLKLNEYELDTCVKVRNSVVYNYRISNYHEMFYKYDWKNTKIENGKNIKYTSYDVSDGIHPIGTVAIDTTETNLNKIIFISGNTTLNNNYFDYCQCEADSSEFVNYLYYKYHRFNDRYDNIHKIGKVTYKINSSFPYNDYRNDCDEIEEKFVKFVFVNNKWEDVNVYYPHEIE